MTKATKARKRKSAPNPVASPPAADTPARVYVAEAQIGDEARAFLNGNVGQLFWARAEADVDAAKEDLLDLDPYAFTSLTDLQNAVVRIQTKAAQARTLQGYFHEAIINGDRAAHALDSPEESD